MLENCKKFSTVIIYLVIIFFPASLVLAIIHELGHVIVALIFNFQVEKISISWFPFSFENSYVIAHVPFNAPSWENIFFYLGGSIFTVVVGALCFLFFYEFKLNPFIELFLFVYFFILSFEFLIYNLIDVFFLNFGDWSFVYSIDSEVNGFFLIVGIAFLILLVKYFRPILKHLDVCIV